MPPEPVKISLIASAPADLDQVGPLCASLDALPKQGFELIAAGPGLTDGFSRELAGGLRGRRARLRAGQ